MAETSTTRQLGFLTVMREETGYLGGYLVTNQWGRPLEFRLSTAVKPNRVQEILYGDTLEKYIVADLIGKTLLEKTASSIDAVVTDREPALDLRLQIEQPVMWLADMPDQLVPHNQFPDDEQQFRSVVGNRASFSYSEPFERIREAIAEARKMGVTKRG